VLAVILARRTRALPRMERPEGAPDQEARRQALAQDKKLGRP